MAKRHTKSEEPWVVTIEFSSAALDRIIAGELIDLLPGVRRKISLQKRMILRAEAKAPKARKAS